MSISSNNVYSSAASHPQPFRWLSPYRPTTFRVVCSLGITAIFLLVMNLLVAGTFTAAIYAGALTTAVLAYLLAEVLLVTVIVVGPFAAFIYGVIAFFTR